MPNKSYLIANCTLPDELITGMAVQKIKLPLHILICNSAILLIFIRQINHENLAGEALLPNIFSSKKKCALIRKHVTKLSAKEMLQGNNRE